MRTASPAVWTTLSNHVHEVAGSDAAPPLRAAASTLATACVAGSNSMPSLRLLSAGMLTRNENDRLPKLRSSGDEYPTSRTE